MASDSNSGTNSLGHHHWLKAGALTVLLLSGLCRQQASHLFQLALFHVSVGDGCCRWGCAMWIPAPVSRTKTLQATLPACGTGGQLRNYGQAKKLGTHLHKFSIELAALPKIFMPNAMAVGLKTQPMTPCCIEMLQVSFLLHICPFLAGPQSIIFPLCDEPFLNVLADQNGHGTHTAGILGAVGNNLFGVTGVAWNVSGCRVAHNKLAPTR